MSDRRSELATLKLRGFAATPATAELTYRSRRTRLVSSLLALLGCLALAPLLFLIPPHLPWGLAAVIAGIFLAYRRWAGEYVVHSFEGRCPSCGGDLVMKPDQLIHLPHTMPCYSCHQEPELQLAHPVPRRD